MFSRGNLSFKLPVLSWDFLLKKVRTKLWMLLVVIVLYCSIEIPEGRGSTIADAEKLLLELDDTKSLLRYRQRIAILDFHITVLRNRIT